MSVRVRLVPFSCCSSTYFQPSCMESRYRLRFFFNFERANLFLGWIHAMGMYVDMIDYINTPVRERIEMQERFSEARLASGEVSMSILI
jgi:hypothetical protein